MKFLYVYGTDYSALQFQQNNDVQKVYRDMVENGETKRVIDDDIIEIVEFGEVDSKFISFVKNSLCDYDQLKDADIFEVEEK